MSTAVQKRPTLAGLNVTFGLLSMKGNVLTVKKANSNKSEEFKMVCPLHPETPHGVKQCYVCINDTAGETFLPGECLKGREEGDDLILVPKDAIADARQGGDLPAKTLELRAHPFDPSATFASGSAYVFQPEAASQFYATLLALMDTDGVIQTESGPKVLVGLVSLRKGSETFMQLDRWGDQLVLRELVRPEDVDSFEPVDAVADTKLLNMARQLIDATAEEFDPEVYKASVRDRIAALVEQAKNGEIDLEVFAKPTATVDDMAAILEASLEAAKAKKA